MRPARSIPEAIAAAARALYADARLALRPPTAVGRVVEAWARQPHALTIHAVRRV